MTVESTRSPSAQGHFGSKFVLRVGGVGFRAITLLSGMFIASIVLVSEALAEPEVYKHGRHKLQLEKDDDGIGKRLFLDGKAIIEDWSVTIENRAVVGGVPVVIGESSMGGNACSPTMFLIAFPPGRKPRVHTEIGDCSSVSAEIKNSSVHFKTREFPGIPGMHVRWSPSKGLETLPNIVFTPDPKKDWNSVDVEPRPRVVELFDIPPIADLLYQLIRGDADDVMWIVNGWDEPGRIRAGHYIGDSCHYRDCTDSKVLVILDLKKKKAYLAWSDGDREKIVFRPGLSVWKGVAGQELESWMRRSGD